MTRPDGYFLKSNITNAIQSYFLRIINDDLGGDVFFLQVGANDGSMHDPLVSVVKHNKWKGILVEPVPIFFEQLKTNYEGFDGLDFVQVACADVAGKLPFYQIRNVERLRWDAMRGMSSLNRDVLRRHFQNDAEFNEFVERVDIPVVTVNELLVERGVNKINVVLIDTEGADWRVLQSFDVKTYQPELIMVEHLHLSAEDRTRMSRYMHDCGYHRCVGVMDTFFYKPAMLSVEELDALAPFRNPFLTLR